MLGKKKGTKLMELENLYNIAANNNIGVYAFDLKECEIVEVQDEEETIWFEILSLLKECEKRGLK